MLFQWRPTTALSYLHAPGKWVLLIPYPREKISGKFLGEITVETYDIPNLKNLLGISTTTARSYLRQGLIKGRKVGKHWVVCEDALNAFLMNAEANAAQCQGKCRNSPCHDENRPVRPSEEGKTTTQDNGTGWNDPVTNRWRMP